MIQYIDEINRILWACDKLGPDGADLDSLIRICSSIVICARLPNHNETVEFCEEIGLIRINNGRVKITSLGQTMWAANPTQRYELTDSQKEIYISACLLNDYFRSDLNQLVVQFSPDYSTNTLVHSKTDDPPFTGAPELLYNLRDLGVIEDTETELKISQKYAQPLLSHSSEALSLSDLKEILAVQEQIGELAEMLVLTFEQERLSTSGNHLEANSVRRISTINTKAGFDIISFNGKSVDMNHDRFIEVKGSSKTQLNFFLSRGELDKAKGLGKKYWIYFVGGVNLSSSSALEPNMLQDPHDLLKNGKLKAECELFHITTN